MSTRPIAAIARIDDVVALTPRVVDVEVPGLRLEGRRRVPAIVWRWSGAPALRAGLAPGALVQAFSLQHFFEFARLDPSRHTRAWRRADRDEDAIIVMDALPGVAFSALSRGLLSGRGQIPVDTALTVWADVVALLLPHLPLLDQMHMGGLRSWGAPSVWSLLRLGLDGQVGLQPTRLELHDSLLETSAGARCAPGVRALHHLGLVGWILLCGDGPRPLPAPDLAAALRDQQEPRRPALSLRADLPPGIAAALDGLVDPERCIETGATIEAVVRRALVDLGVAPDPRDREPRHRTFMAALLADLFPDLVRQERAFIDEAAMVDVDDVPAIPLGAPLETLGTHRAILAVDREVRRSLLTQT